ncbi:H(+)/Cl(-) exchange transporter 3 [Colletotrichum fructicola]|uniref:Chloride channel protein n=1 Tax=Colletotrichum fructicola (strain Nara gc5) TaxID=1213859 RepID=A0A7J6J5Y9_COLFN|nr:H(+)/Cl(-) exchange transporter 3 [Colletotrichum fructicola]KAE9567372.1 H(+)/Cl(-) exchange transporter 3 [Colletotrichum fructicola]KAF4416621.1 H(+)/Cl(-) exchange transporter 3 [Colletotrichum fructicola]KAF4484309.1 H(+)/Cl(-) exchange transporter 3 [Colletotrichum fructicola Nara gc5]
MTGHANNDSSASSSSRPLNNGSSSSNSNSNSNSNSPPGDRDELELWSEDEDIADVLTEDPIRDREDLEEPLSFKRKQKQNVLSTPGRFLSAITGSRPGTDSPHSSPRARTPIQDAGRPGFTSPRRTGGNATTTHGTKDGAPLDWYVEGPGRRVGYEDLTAIDWIFEYTKERQRLRVLYASAQGLLGYFQQLVDSSQVWIILILTGMAVGAVAAGIDITTDWLGDLKTGYCSGGPEGGAFYLNKGFCCWGYDEFSKCAGWTPWAKALGVSSTGGKWFIEYFFFMFLSVVLACAAAILVREYGIYAKHSGIPEIKTVLGGFIIRRFLGSWTLITKSLGLCLAVGSGMWLGKEGPLVHVACCCANLFIKLFSNINENEARKREVLSAAAASGISVAFGSPIGGVLFSLEQISYYFPDKTMWQSFVCAMTAAVVLQAFDPFRTGQLVMYQVKYSTGWHGFELIPFALLGIMGGIYGGLFVKANMAVARWKKNTPWLPGPITQVAAVALLTALINYPNSYMKFQTSELVSNLFVECTKYVDDQIGLCKTGVASAPTIVLLVFGAVLGFFLATITFGLQLPAGIILPSMAIGALSGRAVGIIMEIWVANHPTFFPFASCEPDVPCVIPGTYAIIGAAASLAGVTKMTVSIVVIMFELTGALTYVLPIMIAVMISKWVGDAISRRGIYEAWIHFNEYPFLDNSEEMVIPDIPASQIMTRIEDLVVLTATGHTIASLKNILDTHPYRGFPVISDPRDAILLGYISRQELTYNLRTSSSPPRSLPPETEAYFSHQPLADPRTTLDLRPWMDQTPITMPSRSSLHLAVTYFQKLGLRYVLFSDRGALQGLLTKKDVWYVLNGAEETRRTSGLSRDMGVQSGLTREDGGGEQRGLLRDDGHEEGISPADDRDTIL